MIRGPETELKYERSVQPVPRLGEWIDVFTGLLEAEATLQSELTGKLLSDREALHRDLDLPTIRFKCFYEKLAIPDASEEV